MRARIDLVTRVEPVVRGVVSDRLGVPADALRVPVSLVDDLAVDSLDLLEIVIDLESAFTIVIPEREIDRVRTIADLAELVAKYVWERDHPEPFPARRIAA
jgi:acyl carrier protein